MNDLPIGIFDSGVGGLSVMREVVRLLPKERILYFADTANLPYGDKSPEALRSCVLESVRVLVRKEIKLLLLACHTASCHTLETLRKQYTFPVLGMVEPSLALVRPTHKRLALLGTESTIASKIYSSKIQQAFPRLKLFSLSCPPFVSLIEKEDPHLDHIVSSYLNPLRKKDLDAVLLACTHYSLIAPLLQKALGPKVELLDPANRCAKEIKELLLHKRLLNQGKEAPSYIFHATGNTASLQRALKAPLRVDN